jgi:hypothetical protein
MLPNNTSGKGGIAMTFGAKMEYLEQTALRYKKATRDQKTAILNEFCQTYQCHRKHAIRAMRNFKRFAKPKQRKPGRPSRYKNQSLTKALKHIWIEAHLPCSKRLHSILPLWIPSYEIEFGPLSTSTREKLLHISASTIDRLLEPIRHRYRGKGRSLTKPGSLLRNQIPISTNQWDQAQPGYIEADTVHHCGESTAGMYALTVNYTDIATGWTEQRAVWGKGQRGVFTQTEHVEASLPFPIKGFDSDNGFEFINEHLFHYFTKRPRNPVQFTRSRAYQKNDNAHIEQKNWTHVRQWIGYRRLDNPKTVPLLNQLYTQEWRLFHNFFLPSVKLIEKKRVDSKITKRYDKPQTPYQRIMNNQTVSDTEKQQLTNQCKNLNPFHLKKIIVSKINCILKTQQQYDTKGKLKP